MKKNNAIANQSVNSETVDQAAKVNCPELTRLKALVEKYEKALPKWISVEDALPESEMPVLVAVSINGFTEVKTDKFRIVDSYGLEKNWFHYFNVTHWMPLPENPQIATNALNK